MDIENKPFLYDKYYELPEIEKRGNVEFYEDHDEGIHYVIITIENIEYWFRYTNDGYIIDHVWSKFILAKNS